MDKASRQTEIWLRQLNEQMQRVQVIVWFGYGGYATSPLLLIIHIHDLDSAITICMKKFADDTKIERLVRSENDSTMIQEELNGLHDWFNKRLVQYNVNKRSDLGIKKRPLNIY